MTAHRALLDRAGALREGEGALEGLRDADSTRVVVVRGGRARVADDRLVLVPPAEVGEADWALLGRDEQGHAILLASVDEIDDALDAVPEETWLGVRDAGGRLAGVDGEILVTAVALAGWLREARFCPSCGAGTTVRTAGWSRTCEGGHEIFPRMDPAVIVAVESPDGERLLLGANANWRGRMYSCFAGFVEAGESLEATVHRELEEEAGIVLDDLRYISSQAWPFPRSLMLGFRAVASEAQPARADGEEIIDVRWFTRDEIGSALRGEGPVGLPGPASIARALIEDWYEDRA